MNKETRNAIERATQRARRLLEEDFAAQLEGDFDVHVDGTVAAKAGSHLSARLAFQRERIIAAVEHKRAASMGAADSVADYLRDAAFTTLNRFVALKMLEARDLVQECITKGEQSSGYREFCGMAPGLPLLPDSAGYRLYIESLFDELSTEVKVLFDRRDPSSVLWPKRATFEQLLEILNATELAGVWGEDESIGWVYQFFNGPDERRKMREESQAPRNSRELAVRNQFFTPRYVVQFLTDNTLGRIWYEMRGTKTALADRCEYMVRRPGEGFEPRTKKDPRDLRVLDPACGSGHFLLYAFDLLLAIYGEAHVDPESPRSEATGRTLAEDYPNLDALRGALPGLILAHNLHGVDIDPRCAQIAQLALWMRAQKAYRDLHVGRAERAQIRRSNIIVAEPLVADDQLAKEFVAKLGDAELGRVFTALVASLNLAGDLGLLLRIEQLVARETRRGQTGNLFAPPEERIRAALERFVREEANATNAQRRLFADDAAHGIGLLATAELRFDVVLMNPPFGQSTAAAKQYLTTEDQPGKDDIGAAFIARGCDLLATGGLLGALANRTYLAIQSLEDWRRAFLLGTRSLYALADLGYGVLDDAMVEAAAYVIENAPRDTAACFDLLQYQDKQAQLHQRLAAYVNSPNVVVHHLEAFRHFACSVIAHWLPSDLLERATKMSTLGKSIGKSKAGFDTGDNFRYLRLVWEVSPEDIGSGDQRWAVCNKGGEYAPYFEEPHLVVNWKALERELGAVPGARVFNVEYCFRSGVVYPMRTTSDFSPRPLPSNCAFNKGAQFIDVSSSLAGAFIALAYTRPFKAFVEATYGGGDVSVSGSAARNYTVGVLEAVPVPPMTAEVERQLYSAFEKGARHVMAQRRSIEPSAYFEISSLSLQGSVDGLLKRMQDEIRERVAEVGHSALTADQIACNLYGFAEEDLRALWGPHPFAYERRALAAAEAARLTSIVKELLAGRWSPDDIVLGDGGFSGSKRVLTKKGFFSHRLTEVLAHLFGVHPDCVFDTVVNLSEWSDHARRTIASDVASALFGIAIGRWAVADVGRSSDPADPFGPMPIPTAVRHSAGILEDGRSSDRLRDSLDAAIQALGGETDEIRRALTQALGLPGEMLESWFSTRFFTEHLSRYSASRRKAPIYWQLATPSASYSVWLYLHCFSKDTLFRVQNDYAARKLAHEERRLESLTSELRDGATAVQRKALAAQEFFVEELRAFLEEVKRVAPIWKPNLDDGVIINFAPLWRLVPQNKPWQRELKSTWDALREGKYDWAYLAMHLWPERVVPKCARDRSLAIAHGLEDVFWVEGTDGKWTVRKMPTHSVEELVRERTSPAVKSALKNLLEAPVAIGTGGRGRRGRRKAAAEGENV
ncbi:MAG: hypothetical protein E6Q92_12975 [Burkholderiaceae bacterium]|nr:MAG: hypothetical protein E6Q92_12975 [Burkholderiaceae bacterium]